jgi:hypothetical protein
MNEEFVRLDAYEVVADRLRRTWRFPPPLLGRKRVGRR